VLKNGSKPKTKRPKPPMDFIKKDLIGFDEGRIAWAVCWWNSMGWWVVQHDRYGDIIRDKAVYKTRKEARDFKSNLLVSTSHKERLKIKKISVSLSFRD
jgi:hypothetical protein